MTLNRILQAARASMIHGHHAPHSYRAWVQGQGYVNDGTIGATRADYLAQLDRAVQSEIENMGYAPEYAEPGYQPKRGVLFANWNRFPRGFDSVLERAGYAVEWSDEWTTCDDCGKAIRTQPDGFDWRPAYRDDDDGLLLCTACYVENHDDSENDDSDDDDDDDSADA